MRKFTFGVPEEFVPSRYCDHFNYKETEVSWKESDFSFRVTPKGCVLEFAIAPDTAVYGFGLQLYSFDHRGTKLTTRTNADPPRNTGDSHAPVPFFVTNKGYGIWFDTARYAEFYCGVKKPGGEAKKEAFEAKLTTDELYAARGADEALTFSVFIPSAKGIDLYVIEGETITDITSQYNLLAGGGPDVPEWGLGVLYRCNGRYNADQVTEIAEYMRENDIPCDILGLEPGWHSHAYSCTYSWNKENYPEPEKFLKHIISDLGYHVNLWEHAFVHPDSPIHDKLLPYSADYCVWEGLVPDFSLPEAREIFAGYHREKLVALGVDGFKADECDGSDYTGGWTFPNHAKFPSGLDGEQYHNLFGVLYAKTMSEAIGKPTLSEIRSMGSLGAPYPYVLYSDLSDITAFLTGVVNSGFSGILWTPEVRWCKTKKELLRRLQMVTFSVQCLINAWNCPEIPWKPFDCVDEVKEILGMRKALIPKLKAAFDKYRGEGVPPVRALVMDYTSDPETRNIVDEYLFCDDLLVAPFTDFESDTRKLYIPAGEWVDYFTGEKVACGWQDYTSENIPVFRKIGE